MTYEEAINYLDSFTNYEKVDSYNYKSSLKLDRMRRLAALLGDPQKAIPAIHVAGTKGKGSTSVYIYSILRCANFRVGLYTSPHLISFRERIRINDSLISEDDLARILDKIKKTVGSLMEDDKPSFFEVYTMLAYLYFKEKKIDFAVYEVGLGGRLDATNIIEPLVCVITPLSYEHTDKLGSTLKEIAAEKCGIIKDNSICVSAPQQEEARKLIEDTCRIRHSRLISVGKDINFEPLNLDDKETVFAVSGIYGNYSRLSSKLIGSHQMINATTAIGAVEALKERGIKIPADAVRKGIEDARWEGRLEIVGRKPIIVLDGAQNRASAQVLAEAIKKIFTYRKLILVLGVSKDKDVSGILEELLPICDLLILTKSRVVSRAMEPIKIKEAIAGVKHGVKDIILTTGVEDALDKAVSLAGKDDLILVTGSLFVVGEVKESLSGCLKAV